MHFNIRYCPHLKGEDAIANRIAIELVALHQENKLNCLWGHVPNETIIRNQQDYGYLKKRQNLGTISGFSDYVFIKNGSEKTLLVEVKTEKGVLSSKQKDFQKWAKDQNIKYHVVRSWTDLKAILLADGLILQ